MLFARHFGVERLPFGLADALDPERVGRGRQAHFLQAEVLGSHRHDAIAEFAGCWIVRAVGGLGDRPDRGIHDDCVAQFLAGYESPGHVVEGLEASKKVFEAFAF